MAPLAVMTALALGIGGLSLYGITATQTAAHQGAIAYAKTSNPWYARVAAQDSLPSWLPVNVSTFGPDHGVIVTTKLPSILGAPRPTVTRRAVMP